MRICSNSVQTPMQVLAENFVCDDRPGVDGVDISSPSGATWPLRFTVPALSSRTIMHPQIWWSSLAQDPNKHDTKRCVLPLDPSLSASRIPPAPSPCPSPPRPPSPPEAAPPPPHVPTAQQNAAASFHPAARGNGQAGTPALRASVCAPCCTRAPLCTTPPQYRDRERGREGGGERGRERERQRQRQRGGGRETVREREISSPSGARWH